MSGVARRGARPREAGFTLVELLVVLVVLPMVVGAVTDVIITAVRNDVVVSGRLSVTQAAQVLSSYFYRDVTSATYVTTDTAEACGNPNTTVEGYTLTTPALSLGLSGNGASTVVTYWLDPMAAAQSSAAVVRITCGVGSPRVFEDPDGSNTYYSTVQSVVVAPLGEGTFGYLDASVDGQDVTQGWTGTVPGQIVSLSAGHQAGAGQGSDMQIALVAATTTGPVTTTTGPESRPGT
ncbi:MAG: prepilin-type N-terminal cleavage/methylation domain-containing protein [Acidobacteriota bacterium]|nr:prepilin-type N-terminal cleavage/methylation domain-containing protein [Acidobacteriota bacterium]